MPREVGSEFQRDGVEIVRKVRLERVKESKSRNENNIRENSESVRLLLILN